MRLPLPVRPKGRIPQDENRVPLKIMRPLALRERVSGRGEKSAQGECLQEMQIMMACFKANEFIEAPCSKEVVKFQQCVNESQKAWQYKKELIKKGETVGTKKLSHLQLNQVFKRFPSQ